MAINRITYRNRVDQAVAELRTSPVSHKLIQRLWFTPQHRMDVADLSRQAGLDIDETMKGLKHLERDGIVVDRGGDGGARVYEIDRRASVHALVNRVLATDAESAQARR